MKREKDMEELTKAVIDLQSYGLKLYTIEKMVRDIYKSAEELKKPLNSKTIRNVTKESSKSAMRRGYTTSNY